MMHRRFNLDVFWLHGGSSHLPLRALSPVQAKREAEALLLEDDVYNVRRARLGGGNGTTWEIDTALLPRGQVQWHASYA